MLNPADDAFLADLARALPPDSLRPAEPRHLEEPRGRWRGRPGAVALPRDAAQVSAILRACAAARVGVVPWGGGTGLVGGQLLPEGPLALIVSLERMTRVRAIWPQEGVMEVEAGLTLAEARAAAAGAGRLFPLSLASEGSCRIGGNLATNAGGVNVLRYGNARDLCLGIEAVLPDGTLFNGLRRLRKDNTGYDLRGLLIGAEGTLGVITAATLRLYPRPAREGAAVLAVAGPAAALRLLALAQDIAGEGLSAFELIHRQGLEFLAETGFDLRPPLAPLPDWMVLIDLGLGADEDPQARLVAIFEAGLRDGLVADGVVAQSQAQRAAFWALRETIPLANRRVGAVVSHDISLPLSEIPGFLHRAGAELARLADFRINCFGHLGDGNLHYNLFPAAGRKAADYAGQRGAAQRLVHDMVHELGGSVSAEHGIGRMKVADLLRYGDAGKLAAMRAIKAALDPMGIMNPGAVLA